MTRDGKAEAKALRTRFAIRKTALLEECAAERRTMRDVLLTLERTYVNQTRDYLKVKHTVYAVWLEHGPLAELEEVRAATRDPAVWDRLVETYAERGACDGIAREQRTLDGLRELVEVANEINDGCGGPDDFDLGGES